MTTEEIAVVVFLGFAGYLGTAAVIRHFQAKASAGQTQPPPQADTQPAGAQQHWAEVLEVDPNASWNTIKEAYRHKIAQYHPDKVLDLGPELKEIAQRKSGEINEAYRQAELEKTGF